MPDDIERAQEREQQDRERALQADAERRAREQPAPRRAIGLCRLGCGYMVEEPRIRLGLETCAACAREAEEQRQRDARRYRQ